MYDPLIKLKFRDFEPSFVRASSIKRLDTGSKKVVIETDKSNYTFLNVTNIDEAIERINEIEYINHYINHYIK